MGFKKIDRKMGFAELALASSMEKNRSLETLEQMKKLPNVKNLIQLPFMFKEEWWHTIDNMK